MMETTTAKAPRFPTYKLRPFEDRITRRNYSRMEFFTDSFGIEAVKVYFIHEGKETFVNVYAPYYVARFKAWHEAQPK